MITPERAQYVEEVGVFFEGQGLPRMAGRVLGFLMTAEPPLQPTGALIDALSASKGAISLTTRMLVDLGLIERVGVPGDRRDHYRVRADAWVRLLARNAVMASAMRELAERGLAVTPDTPAACTQLEEMRDLFAFIEREYPALLERWQREREEPRNTRS
ncbi:GbsR/MarR family transcriptional regulator [Deinococcus apachensis]|uniref:GbsR/MarR family transcriptional regulator n=1 Tax=Deinococcus apachensis TaxID=309886 RepID=UPI00035E5730|nr:MarR family transcriptional regulator [Deinococcus apachensis]